MISRHWGHADGGRRIALLGAALLLAAGAVLPGRTAEGEETGPAKLVPSSAETAGDESVSLMSRRTPAESAAPEQNPVVRSREQYPAITLNMGKSPALLVRDLPDLSRATSLELANIEVAAVPDELLHEIALRGGSLEALYINVRKSSPERENPTISDAGMESIARLTNLNRLVVGGRCSEKGFESLARLTKLRALGIRGASVGARCYFHVLSQLPDIDTAGALDADFSQPIDAETFKAIASLNGRLETLSFGEWGETKVHVSFLPAIAEIQTLTALDLGSLCGTDRNVSVVECLKKLPYLDRLTPTRSEATAMQQFRSRETYPVEFRPVHTPSAMMALLRYLLGPADSQKIGKQVVRRRVGLAPVEDFTQSVKPVSQILEESFGIANTGRAWTSLEFIRSQYPELDQQIRRYLSAQDLAPPPPAP